MFFDINLNPVTIFYQCDQASVKGFGCDVSDYKSVRATTETSIGDQRHAFTKTRAHDQRCRLQHLGHAGSASRSDIANDDYISFFNSSFFQSIEQFELTIEYAGRSFESFAF